MISIIILSSDGYSDCWNPLFTSFKKYFEGIENYEIILSTNSKEYSFPGLNVLSLTNGINTPWSKRLQMSLEEAKYDIVLVMVEDFVLRSKINSKDFYQLVELMQDSNNVGHIRLLSVVNKLSTKPSNY